MYNSEKLIKEVIFKNALKLHKFEINDDGEIIKGDIKALKKDLSDYKVTVEDRGVGFYEYWGSRGEDTNLVLEIENGCAELLVNAPKEFDIKSIVEILTESGHIDTVIEVDSDDDFNEERPRKRNLEIKGKFVLKIKNHRVINMVHKFTLCYEKK